MLEDNLRVPSGVSYVLENREVMKRIFPRVFEGLSVRPGERIPEPPAGDAGIDRAAPRRRVRAWCVLTPGIYNSAYFEHSFLAQQMGVQLVEGRDLVVDGRRRLHAHHQGPASGWTSSTAASTTTSSIPRRSAPTRCWAFPG